MARLPASSPRADAGSRIVIRMLAPDELDAAGDLLAEGMRDNPVRVRRSVQSTTLSTTPAMISGWLPGTSTQTVRCRVDV